MAQQLSRSARKVQHTLQALGFSCQVVELPQTTRTAAEAAQAIGCQVGQIAKSLIFRSQQTDKPILVITSGSNRVSERKIAEQIGEPITKADADFVRQRTGYVIGGVPPVGHQTQLDTFIDQDLLSYEKIWAAAGTPEAVFELTSADLVHMTGGHVISVK